MTTALLIIDMQNYVLADCANVSAIVDRCAALAERGRSEGADVIWTQHHRDGIMPKGSKGWYIAPGLPVAEGEQIVQKKYWDAFAETDLASTLASLTATRLIIAGAQSDLCVRSTLQRAVVGGYDVTLVADAHTAADAEYAGVRLSAKQIIAQTNAFAAKLRASGASSTVATHDQVSF